jgi:hypothetical protein
MMGDNRQEMRVYLRDAVWRKGIGRDAAEENYDKSLLVEL